METIPELQIIPISERRIKEAGANVFLPFIISAYTASHKLNIPFDYQHWTVIRQGVGHWTLICKNEIGIEVFRQSVDINTEMDERVLKYCFTISNGRLIYIMLKKHFYMNDRMGKICWIIK